MAKQVCRKIDRKKRKTLLYEFEYVRDYFEIWHGIDICSNNEDSLEKVTAILFKDVISAPPSERPAFSVFKSFLSLFCDILGETTNNLRTDRETKMYQIISSYLKNGTKPENITIISFNYDIYLEKVLASLALSFPNPDIIIFLIQHAYELNLEIFDITRPPRPRKGYFPIYPGMRKGGIKVLKLHGSLNWYSYYLTNPVDFVTMFDIHRELKVTGEKEINSSLLKYRTREGQIVGTLPVIVPPLPRKSGFYHSKILRLWRKANTALSAADELLIYGYSCPLTDEDSKNLLKDSISNSLRIKKISIIDSSPEVCERYIRIFTPKKVLWYQHSAYFV